MVYSMTIEDVVVVVVVVDHDDDVGQLASQILQ